MSDNLYFHSDRKILRSCLIMSLFAGAALVSQGAAAQEAPELQGELPPISGFFQLFETEADLGGFYLSDFDFGGDTMVTGYRRDRIAYDAEAKEVILSLSPAPEGSEKAFWGAELQRDGGHGYGDYEVVMQPAKAEGVVSSFFTYTGGTFGDPHHEIDIEFLGKDTTGLYANIFVDGKQMPGRHIPLGFDASEGMHLYRFEWRPEGVRWFVDGKEIFYAAASETAMPQFRGKLFANIWAVAELQEPWAGEVDPDTNVKARYGCMSYVPLGRGGLQCQDFGPWTTDPSAPETASEGHEEG